MYSINIKVFCILCVGLILPLFAGQNLAAAESFRTVVLDPGHGGRDGGAYHYGVKEKDANLDVAKRVERLLRARGISVVMTRRTDTYVSLESRAAIANRYRSAIFVSIHFNGSTNRSAQGVESYYYSTKGKSLASSLHRYIAARSGTKNRGLKRRPYAVLTKTRCTAALVECGFLSNHWECKRCASSSYRETMARAIADGICRYKR